MKVNDIDIRHYFAAERYLNGKFVRKLAHNTYLVKRDGYVECTYHGHTIARFYPHHMTVSSCGYQTVTTKVRLNRLIPWHFNIYQRDFVWHVCDTRTGNDWLYHDGMVFEYE